MAAKAKKELEVINAKIVEATSVAETVGVVTIQGHEYTPTIFQIDAAERDEINGYATKLSNGEVFTPSEIDVVIGYSRSYTALAVQSTGLAVAIVGEESQLFQPFAVWAESLCCDKNGKLVLRGGNVTAETTNGGLLNASMVAVLAELVAGKASKKAAKFTARNAGKAQVTEISGQSEEISATGNVSIIGQDNEGQMLRILDKLYEASELASSKNANFVRVSALLDSIATRNQIDHATLFQTLQAAIYGQHSAACNQLAKRCAAIVKDGARAVSA